MQEPGKRKRPSRRSRPIAPLGSLRGEDHGRGGAWTPGGDRLVGRTVRRRFALVERLAEGGLATVYRAEDLSRPDSPAAVKVLHEVYSGVPEVRRRFARETAVSLAVGKLVGAAARDAGIARLDGARPFLSLDLIAGPTLAERLRRDPPDPAEAMAIALSLCERLETLHRAGVVHRDLKPENLLLAAVPREALRSTADDPEAWLVATDVRLLDFDAAAPFAQAAGEGVFRDALPAIVGHGSAGYSAPEQWDEQVPPDPRADVYAAGALLFEMVCRRRPFQGDPAAQIEAHLHLSPPRARDLVPSLPAPLDALIARALEKDPARRFASARAMRDALLDAWPALRLRPA